MTSFEEKKVFLKNFLDEKGENVTLIIYVFRFLFEKNICSEKKKNPLKGIGMNSLT